MFPLSSIYQHFPVENTSENDDHDQNPNSSDGQDQHVHENHQYCSPYSNFPTIFEDDGLFLSHLLSQQQVILTGTTTSHNSQEEISVVVSNQALLDHHDILDHDQNPSHEKCPSKLGFSKKTERAKAKTVMSRRRTGKKDRHSKINTAQGLRDRRMRLSLQIARKFFDLQDMLGFDKASKTIEWLITKSKSAIKELKHSLAKQSSTSSASDGEVMSKTAGKEGDGEDDDDDDDNDLSLIRNMRKEKRIRKFHNPIARESRDKARARARERTKEKFLEKSQNILEKSRQICTSDQANYENVDLGKLGPDDDKTRQEVRNYSLEMVASRLDDQEPGDQLLDYSKSNHVGVSEDDFLGFPGNWNIGNVRNEINPSEFFSTTLKSLSDTEEHKPSSFFPVTITTASDVQSQNPSSIFVTTTSSDTHVEENPSSLFCGAVTTSTGHNYAVAEQNPRPSGPNFLIGSGANIFCSLNF